MPGTQWLGTAGSKPLQLSGIITGTCQLKVSGEDCQGLLLFLGPVGEELGKVPHLPATSPFPELPLKAQRTSHICSEHTNVLGNVKVKWAFPAQEFQPGSPFLSDLQKLEIVLSLQRMGGSSESRAEPSWECWDVEF